MPRKRNVKNEAENPREEETSKEVVKKTGSRTRKATKEPTEKSREPTKKGSKRKATSSESKEESATKISKTDDSTEADDSGVYEKKGSWKIVSWNINGIRAWLTKGGLDYFKREAPDVFCVQETKCSDSKLPAEDLKDLKEYKSSFLAGDKEGYSGVGVLSKREPLNVTSGFGYKKHDSEGRVITLEFEEFFIVNAYVPNAGRGLVRLEYRMSWDVDFRKYLCDLKSKKGVILTGDLNVAHNEIDLKNPKTNKKNAGFTQEERDGLTALLDEGFIDSFRKLYPDKEGAYTFWSYMMNARAKNVGWRLDYFIISEDLVHKLIDNEIRSRVMGSDHCPIVLHFK